MKKSTIKYLVILIVIIIIISFTGYNLETEPHSIIETTSQKQLDFWRDSNASLKYVNLTYGNSKSEYVITYYYVNEDYPANGKAQIGSIYIYKISNKIDFPLTEISVEIKNIKLTGVQCGKISKCQYYPNNTKIVYKQIYFSNYFVHAGNYSIHVSFDIVPVYNVWIYHFNGKEIPYNYNYTLRATPCT